MKMSIAIICTFLFFFCLIVLRDFVAAIMAVLTFLAGVKVGQKEAAVTTYVGGLISKLKEQFESLKK